MEDAPVSEARHLLQVAGPAQSEWLVHFCGRPTGTGESGNVPADIRGQAPWQRLDNILWEQRLRAFAPFGADMPMLCLSESPWPHLAWLIQTRGFPPWGVFLWRQWVYDAGGGPAWHVRRGQQGGIRPEARAWTVRLDTAEGVRSDWLHEREWRLPGLAEDGSVPLWTGGLAAVLVGDPDWQPTVRYWPPQPMRMISAETGMETWPGDPLAVPDMGPPVQAAHPLWGKVPIVAWDAGSQALIFS